MGRVHEIGLAADGKAFDQGIRSGVIKPLEDAEKALEALTKVDAGRDVARDLDRAQDASKKLDTELEQTRRELGKVGVAGKDAGKDVKKGLDDAKTEAKSSGKEAAASFGGGFDDVADFVQEVLANAFEGFGPLGAAAGIALAAAVGTVLANASKTQEKLDAAREAASELARTMYENGGELPLQDAVDRLFETLASEVKPNGPIQSMIDQWVDFGDRMTATRKIAEDLKTPLNDVVTALSGTDLQLSRDLLARVNQELDMMKSNVTTAWVWQTGPLEDMKTQLETTIETARVADDTLSAVGSAFDSQEYRDKIAEVGQAWQDAATDAADYVTETDGITTFDWSAYLADAEATLAAANDYKRKIVTLPEDIRTEAESIFSAQGAVAANAYTDAYIGASAEDRTRFVAAAQANGAAAGTAAGTSLAQETEAAAQALAQGWGPMVMPVDADMSAAESKLAAFRRSVTARLQIPVSVNTGAGSLTWDGG